MVVCAAALEALYRDPARREELARAAVSVAQNPAYSWDAVTRQFDELFVELADDPGELARWEPRHGPQRRPP